MPKARTTIGCVTIHPAVPMGRMFYMQMSNKIESIQNEHLDKGHLKTDGNDVTVDNKITVADVTVMPDEKPLEQVKQSVSGDIEQISKNVTVGRIEIEREDDRNVIYALINAISVRINMPRGTVKALLACLAVLLIAVILIAWNGRDHESAVDSSAETQDATAQREYASEDESKAVNSQREASKNDYVIISDRYRYDIPEGMEGIYEPDDYYEENETFCDFTYDGDLYSIRSYLLAFTNNELADIVKKSLSEFTGYELISEENIESNYGEVLKIRFEVTDEDGKFTAVTGYYWSDIDPHICCLEVSSDKWHEGKAEEMIMDSVYRIPSGSSGTSDIPSDAEQIWQDQQAEDAMNSMAEDAMREYYNPEPEPTYPW